MTDPQSPAQALGSPADDNRNGYDHHTGMTMIDKVTGGGLLAIRRGQETLAGAAGKIARAGTAGESDATRELTEGAVEMLQAEHLVKAGVRVLKTADEMIGSLFDDKA